MLIAVGVTGLCEPTGREQCGWIFALRMVRASVKSKKEQGSKRQPVERVSLVDDEDDESAGLLGIHDNAPTMHAFETTMLRYERGEIVPPRRRKSPVATKVLFAFMVAFVIGIVVLSTRRAVMRGSDNASINGTTWRPRPLFEAVSRAAPEFVRTLIWGPKNSTETVTAKELPCKELPRWKVRAKIWDQEAKQYALQSHSHEPSSPVV